MCKKCTCNTKATPDLLRLLKIRDALSILIDMGWDIVHIENSLEDELNDINAQIEVLTN